MKSLTPRFRAPETPRKNPEESCNNNGLPDFRACEYPPESAFAAATDAQRAKAAVRLAAVDRSDGLRAGGMSRADADAAAAIEHDVSVRSLGGWRSRVRSASPGDRLAALIDAPRSGRPPREWEGPGAAELWRMFVTDWAREEAPPAEAVHRRLATVAVARGWTLPPLHAFERRTGRELSREAIVRGREGALAVMDLVPHQQRTVAGLSPLEILNGDGRRHDVIVELPSGREGRPCVWMWQDVRTRRILSWRAGETESADLLRTSLHSVITGYGVPERVIVDNTLAASSKWLTGGQPNRRRWRSSAEELPGILHQLEIDYRTTIVDRDAGGRGKGRGRSKPIERGFLDLANQIDTHPLLAGAYTGRSTRDRPETHRMRAASWDEFIDVVGRVVAEHNARPGRRTEAAAGRSFDACWSAEYSAAVVRRLSKSQASVLLLAAEPSRVDRSGCLRLKAGRASGLPANRYHSDQLVAWAGKRVVARFDPAGLHDGVEVFDLDGRHVCHAPCLAPDGFADTERAREYERARRRKRKAAEAELAAIRDMDELTAAHRSLPPALEPEVTEPAAVRLVATPRAAASGDGGRRRDFLSALRKFNNDQ